jgi:histidinol-phosphate phosphatase family protein
MKKQTKAAVFLDRDGVINEDRADYVKNWGEFRFIRGVRRALGRLREFGFPVVVVTNQSAVNRGLLSLETLNEIHTRMSREVARKGGIISGIYFCPHHPEEGCHCRKPRTGLLRRAARELNLDLSKSFMVGDTLRDLRAGKRAGCRTMLVLTGQGGATLKKLGQASLKDWPGFVARDLKGAVEIMIGISRREDQTPVPADQAGIEL